MANVMHLYLDDSGTRHPDRKRPAGQSSHFDWFGLGGVILRETDEGSIREQHASLVRKWQLTYPLHSSEIRACGDNFRWLHSLAKDKKAEFMDDIGAVVTHPALTAIACVIDRPGYNHSFRELYGRDRWLLCKTAFSILVERAVKFARVYEHRLRVFAEKSDKKTDKRLLSYYEALRESGNPFDAGNSSKYAPLCAEQFRETLYEFKTKAKSSPPMQIADICLWPMCVGGYDPANRSYRVLRDAGTLIDSRLAPDAIAERGIKYSCWQLVRTEKTDARS